MSAEPPPPGQVSPDGQFYWDGKHWMPVLALLTLNKPVAAVAAPAAPAAEYGSGENERDIAVDELLERD